jgi:hypothetical protein
VSILGAAEPFSENAKTRANALKQFAFLVLDDAFAFFPKCSMSFTKPIFCEFIKDRYDQNKKTSRAEHGKEHVRPTRGRIVWENQLHIPRF